VTCRIETVGSAAFRICPEPAPLAADRVRAVLSARLVDELTGDPVEVDVEVTTATDGLFPRVARGGLIGLVGQPARLFPTLDINPVALSMRSTAARYLPLQMGGLLGPLAGFPDQFAPLDLGDVALHRAATTVTGRTLRRASLTPGVVAGATVEIVGVWTSFPPADVDPAAVMAAPNLAALAPPCYAARAVGPAQLRQRDVVPVVGREQTLLLSANAGASRLRLSNRMGIAAGGLLVIDRDDPARRERILISGVNMDSDPDQSAWVTLSHPLAYTHWDGASCQPANLLPPGAAHGLTRATIPGDETVFLSGTGGLAAGVTVELDDGVGAPEYHDATLYRTVSDARGFFRLPPIARVAMVAVHAQRLGLVSPADERFTPDYRLAENRLAVVFP
jgi:hypothetical protein